MRTMSSARARWLLVLLPVVSLVALDATLHVVLADVPHGSLGLLLDVAVLLGTAVAAGGVFRDIDRVEQIESPLSQRYR